MALALTTPNLKRLVLVEPPLLNTEAAWVFRLLDRGGGKAGFFRDVLGLDGQATEPRDYLGLIERLGAPATVLLGDEPSPAPHPVTTLPSLVGPAARAALRRHPLVEVIEVAGAGHDIIRTAGPVVLEALQRGCADLTPAGRAG